ncbi:c-type cytochrome [Deinococcus murrayi]|uniref:c-type cytochrome n=1 Tax=Deinococcus murrayi TaxID=68910 RepID=UPI0006877938|nr:cytochrome c [Deinococcus murrayi]
MKRTRRQKWVAGDVLSWVLGVTLGLILGVALLIVVPRLGQAQGEAKAGPEGTIVAQGEGNTATTDARGNEAQNTAAQGTSEGQAGSPSSTDENTAAQGTQASGDEREEGVTSTEAGAQAEADTAAPQEAPSQSDQTAASGSVAPRAGAAEDEAHATGEIGSSTAQNTTERNTAEEAITGAPTGAEGNAQAGQTVFASNCAGCHGANGQGAFGPSLVAADGPKSWTLAQFTTTLREGRTPERELAPTMPRYSEAQLSDAQILDLHAYIKSLN